MEATSTIHPPSFTVCIPTYLGGPSLARAVTSIRASKNVGPFRLIVAVDGNPLKQEITRQLRELDAEIVFSARRGGQVARVKQMIALVNTEITVLTQDDIRFDKLALARLVEAFARDARLTMASAHVKPEPARTFFERIVEIGVNISHRTGLQWHGADNYLLASGRCLAFRTNAIQQFNIPEEVINSDGYLYFENKRRGGKFRHLADAIVYNKSPLHIREHLKQTKKFEYSKAEFSRYFESKLLAAGFAIPRQLLIAALAAELLRRPIYTMLYGGLHLYTKLKPNQFIGAKRFWDTDQSTKRS